MLLLLDGLRAQDVPVQTLGVALQAWLFETQAQLNPADPSHMAHQLELEDTRAFFLRVYGERYDKWDPDYEELQQERKRLNPDEEE